VNPKVRYNIGDEGRLATLPEVMAAVTDPRARAAAEAAMRVDGMRLPLLFLFGRKDSTISYMGANIYPQDIEYGLYGSNPYADLLEGFRLELVQDAELESRPTVHLQLRSGVRLEAAKRDLLADTCRAGVLAHLTASSRDFAASLAEDPSAADLRVVVHEHGDGPFAGAAAELKNAYLIKGQAA